MSVPTEEITALRFHEWAEVLKQAHCTPALLLAIGHDDQSGEIHLLLPEDVPQHWLRAWLELALDSLPDPVPS